MDDEQRPSGVSRAQQKGWTFRAEECLKADLFGRVERGHSSSGTEPSLPAVRRDWRSARIWVRPLAAVLARRERRALERLAGCPGVPVLLGTGSGWLLRSWVGGVPMQVGRPRDPAYYAAALRLLVAVHRRGVVHNDLAKEPNWLVQEDGSPALVDFQLASLPRRRGRWFRMLAREDLRHLLKHKRNYCPGALSPRERKILAAPSAMARLWRKTGKPLYLFTTRRILGWADREGAGDRRT